MNIKLSLRKKNERNQKMCFISKAINTEWDSRERNSAESYQRHKERCVVTWTAFRIWSGHADVQSLPYSLVETIPKVQHALCVINHLKLIIV